MPDFGAAQNTNIAATDSAGGSQSRVQPFPSFPANGTLTSISVYSDNGGFGGAYDVRVGIYSGGASDTSPNGATLLEDIGLVDTAGAPANGSPGWWTINSVTHPSLVASTRYWVVIKGTFALNMYVAQSPNLGDLPGINLGYDVAGNQAFDETVSYTSPFGANALNFVYSSSCYKIYMTYATAGGTASIVFNASQSQRETTITLQTYGVSSTG